MYKPLFRLRRVLTPFSFDSIHSKIPLWRGRLPSLFANPKQEQSSVQGKECGGDHDGKKEHHVCLSAVWSQSVEVGRAVPELRRVEQHG